MRSAAFARTEAARPLLSCRRGLLATASSALLGLSLAAPAHAQDAPVTVPSAAEEAAQPPVVADPGATASAPSPLSGQDIVVTGSRIARRDYTATSPIVTVDAALLERSSSIAIEANLNKLPQFAPALTQFVTGDIQANATNTLGASTVNLRNIGSNRNLVLLDGRRATPVNSTLVIDTNSIPSAAIERVEIITGGASSTYGADAVGGVVNFLLKKNFQGAELDAQMGVTQDGDGREYRLSLITGANFDEGRGNVMVGFEHYRRKEVRAADRSWQRDIWRNPNIGGTDFWPTQDWYDPDSLIIDGVPSQAAVNALFSRAPAGSVPATTNFYFNDDGSVFTGFGGSVGTGNANAGLYKYNGPMGTFRFVDNSANVGGDGVTRTGALQQNDLNQLLSTPLERWSMFARAHYDFGDNISLFGQGYFAKTHVETVSQFAPAITIWSASIPHGSDVYAPSLAPGFNPASYGITCNTLAVGCTNSEAFPVSPELASLLNSRPNPNAPWSFDHVLDDFGTRRTSNDTMTFQLIAGLNGKIAGTDWTWEVYGSHGETHTESDQRGFVSRERWRGVAQSINYGYNFRATGNNPGAIAGEPGFGVFAATATCQYGFNPFDNLQPGEGCQDAVEANLQNEGHATQDVAEANIQGGLFKLPAGDLRFAAGASYRENRYEFDPDPLTRQGSAYYEGIIGIFPAGTTEGKTKATEFYGELLVPVLSGIPAIKQLNLELGYRYSDFNPSGAVSTYKANADWEMTDWFRLRGGYSKASRAPNIAELYQGATLVLSSAGNEGDPCSRANNALPSGQNYSANPALNSNAAAVEAICRARMGSIGAASFYNDTGTNANPTGTYLNTATSFGGISNQLGNPNVKAESAKTFTIGGVLRSPIEGPALSRMRVAVDYYNIKITDLISLTSQNTSERLCFDTAFNPTLSATAPGCLNIFRRSNDGTLDYAAITYGNQGRLKTSGVDVQFDWGLDFKDAGLGLPGAINLNVQFNYLIDYKIQDTPNAIVNDYADTLGTTTPGGVPPAGGTYRYKLFSTLTYAAGPMTTSLQWRHFPSARSAVSLSNPETTQVGAPRYDIFDLSGTLAVTKDIVFRFGVDNLFDKDPPIVDYNPGFAGTANLIGGSVLAGVYDVLGRRFYIGAKARF